MFEQDLKNFIAAEITAGRLINADLTGINEQSSTGEAIGYVYNAGTDTVDQKWLYFYKKNDEIIYRELNKIEPEFPTP